MTSAHLSNNTSGKRYLVLLEKRGRSTVIGDHASLAEAEAQAARHGPAARVIESPFSPPSAEDVERAKAIAKYRGWLTDEGWRWDHEPEGSGPFGF